MLNVDVVQPAGEDFWRETMSFDVMPDDIDTNRLYQYNIEVETSPPGQAMLEGNAANLRAAWQGDRAILNAHFKGRASMSGAISATLSLTRFAVGDPAPLDTIRTLISFHVTVQPTPRPAEPVLRVEEPVPPPVKTASPAATTTPNGINTETTFNPVTASPVTAADVLKTDSTVVPDAKVNVPAEDDALVEYRRPADSAEILQSAPAVPSEATPSTQPAQSNLQSSASEQMSAVLSLPDTLPASLDSGGMRSQSEPSLAEAQNNAFPIAEPLTAPVTPPTAAVSPASQTAAPSQTWTAPSTAVLQTPEPPATPPQTTVAQTTEAQTTPSWPSSPPPASASPTAAPKPEPNRVYSLRGPEPQEPPHTSDTSAGGYGDLPDDSNRADINQTYTNPSYNNQPYNNPSGDRQSSNGQNSGGSGGEGQGNDTVAKSKPTPAVKPANIPRAPVEVKPEPEDLVFEVTAEKMGFQPIKGPLYLCLWPGKPQRVFCIITNNTGDSDQFTLTLNPVTRQRGAENVSINVRFESGAPTIDHSNTGRIVYELTADARFPAADSYEVTGHIAATLTKNEKDEPIKLDLKIAARVKAIPLLALEATEIPRKGVWEEAPTRLCLYVLNRYALSVQNTGNAATAARLEVTHKNKDTKNSYDYIFDRQLINVPYGETVPVSLRVYHRENLGGIFPTRSEFEVKAVPVTNPANALPAIVAKSAGAAKKSSGSSILEVEGARNEGGTGLPAAPEAGSVALSNRKSLVTRKWQLPFWFLFGASFSLLLLGWSLVEAPSHLRIESSDPNVKVVECESDGKKWYAIIGNAEEGDGLRATAKWNTHFFTRFTSNHPSKDQPRGRSWNNQLVYEKAPQTKGETPEREYRASSYLTGHGASATARYYFTIPDVSLLVNGKPPPADDEIYLDVIGNGKAKLQLQNGATTSVRLSYWYADDPPLELFDVENNHQGITLEPERRNEQVFRFKLQPKAAKDAESVWRLITNDVKHPILTIHLQAKPGVAGK